MILLLLLLGALAVVELSLLEDDFVVLSSFQQSKFIQFINKVKEIFIHV